VKVGQSGKSQELTWSNLVRFSPNAFRALEPRTINRPRMRFTCPKSHHDNDMHT
jgi:hypothetical protein